MANATKTHDNREVKEYLYPPSLLWEACEDHPWLDDILTGAVWLKSAGDTSTRPLRKALVYQVLSLCDDITTVAVQDITGGRHSPQHAALYAAAGRVASRAVAARIQGLSGQAPSPPISISNLYKGDLK